LLFVEGRNRRTEVSELVLDQHITYNSLAHHPGTEELVVCIEGSLRVGPQGQEVWLAAGEAVWFPADLPHSYESQSGAKAILYMSYPPALGTPY
jgi:quercetin dioxygenase-like cupin family protein